MSRIISTARLAQALEAEGFELPKHCREVELVLPTAGAVELKYIVFLENEDLAKLGRALARMAATT